jgi:hypothetical protein
VAALWGLNILRVTTAQRRAWGEEIFVNIKFGAWIDAKVCAILRSAFRSMLTVRAAGLATPPDRRLSRTQSASMFGQACSAHLLDTGTGTVAMATLIGELASTGSLNVG